MNVPVVYHSDYFSDIGAHVFPTEKYSLVFEGIQKHFGRLGEEVHVPAPATREQLLRVHTAEYLADLDSCRRTKRTMMSELPITRQIVEAYHLMTGGTCLAMDLALRHGCAINLGGGFHHAFADRAEGFCYVNDVAVATREAQAKSKVERVAIIDTDLHQGNGTAKIFENDPTVFTFSMHQEHLYPPKQQSDLDIGLDRGVSDDEYLEKLATALDTIFTSFVPRLVMYVGGVDPFEKDRLGDLRLTKSGIKNRDNMVFRACRDRGTPVAAVFAGGYATDVRDTVEMHINTYVAMSDVFS